MCVRSHEVDLSFPGTGIIGVCHRTQFSIFNQLLLCVGLNKLNSIFYLLNSTHKNNILTWMSYFC